MTTNAITGSQEFSDFLKKSAEKRKFNTQVECDAIRASVMERISKYPNLARFEFLVESARRPFWEIIVGEINDTPDWSARITQTSIYDQTPNVIIELM